MRPGCILITLQPICSMPCSSSSASRSRNDFLSRNVCLRMKLTCSLLIFISFLILLTSGCSEDPGTVGLGVLPPQDSLQVHSLRLTASSDTTFLARVVGGSSTLLVGKFQSLQAATLLSFAGIPAIPTDAVL